MGTWPCGLGRSEGASIAPAGCQQTPSLQQTGSERRISYRIPPICQWRAHRAPAPQKPGCNPSKSLPLQHGFRPCAPVRAGQAVWRAHDSLGGDMADSSQGPGCGRTAEGVCRASAREIVEPGMPIRVRAGCRPHEAVHAGAVLANPYASGIPAGFSGPGAEKPPKEAEDALPDA